MKRIKVSGHFKYVRVPSKDRTISDPDRPGHEVTVPAYKKIYVAPYEKLVK